MTCSATDAAGNSDSEQFTVTVVDTTAPVISDLPADVIAEADQLGGKIVTFAPTATDAVDGAVSVTCLPGSGSLFPVGYHDRRPARPSTPTATRRPSTHRHHHRHDRRRW